MTFTQALIYFFREAAISLARSWKISVLSILTISVSLFVLGSFLILSGNLARVIDSSWDQGRVVIYLEPNVSDERLAELGDQLVEAELVRSLETIDADEAQRRFEQAFPGLAGLVDGSSSSTTQAASDRTDPMGGEASEDASSENRPRARRPEALPASLEVEVDPAALETEAFRIWIAEVRELDEVSMVDDDRDWLRQLDTFVALARGSGLILAILLLSAAIFTIGSVIRLTVYLYQDEFSVMRLVGATEFFIRGPFYAEGMLQGLIGGCVAALGLWTTHAWIATRTSDSLLGATLFGPFLRPQWLALLIALGALAGLVGAVISLRRERFSASPEE